MNRLRPVLDGLQTLLDRQLSIRQLVHLALVTGAGLAVALGGYLAIGLIWANNHVEHLADVHGLDKLFSVLGEIVAWPVLIIADVTLR